MATATFHCGICATLCRATLGDGQVCAVCKKAANLTPIYLCAKHPRHAFCAQCPLPWFTPWVNSVLAREALFLTDALALWRIACRVARHHDNNLSPQPPNTTASNYAAAPTPTDDAAPSDSNDIGQRDHSGTFVIAHGSTDLSATRSSNAHTRPQGPPNVIANGSTNVIAHDSTDVSCHRRSRDSRARHRLACSPALPDAPSRTCGGHGSP